MPGKQDGDGFDSAVDYRGGGDDPESLFRREFQQEYPQGDCRVHYFLSPVANISLPGSPVFLK